ncbi:hypothetical protein BGW42_007138 [Actinomortierella wolfii]|nr:hypothetical protein BGW42_007138 [Actinomortierella wolfii]
MISAYSSLTFFDLPLELQLMILERLELKDLAVTMLATTIIIRENERIMQNTLLQMKVKVDQVRQALDRQTRALEETQRRLTMLASKLNHMEDRGRQREQARIREQILQAQKAEDDRWFSDWASSEEVKKLQLDQMDLEEWTRI